MKMRVSFLCSAMLAAAVPAFASRAFAQSAAESTLSQSSASLMVEPQPFKGSNLAPGQIAAGQLVSAPLKFARKEDRTLHLRIRLADEEHSFTILAPGE